MKSRLERFFDFESRGARWRDEAIGGATTFLTMSYIIFVQPALLAQAGMDFGAVMTATCLSAAFATVIMAVWANYPIVLAPGMGENFYFVFGVVLATGMIWTEAMAAVFYAGIIFVLLSFSRVRKIILDAIPDVLKTAIGIGIGLFIALMGFQNAGLVVKNPGGLIQLGDLSQAPVLLSIGGLLLTAMFLARRIPGAIFWGILATAIGGVLLRVVHLDGFVSLPPSLGPTFARLDWTPTIDTAFLTAVFVFLFLDLFDTTGTLAGLGKRAGYFKEGRLPRAQRAFAADALGTVGGAVLGTSTVTAYIESAAGIVAGAKTGVAALVAAALFLLSMFFAPLVRAIGSGVVTAEGVTLYPITAPALIIVGALMIQLVRDIRWDDPTESIPAFLVAIGMPITYSITDGLAFGFISYPLVKLASGRGREIHPALYIIAVLFIVRYLLT
ncbi:MAG TPA: NCS2 family permease [Acidobacteriota bacterium]|nr:NCS2 family permease [Acidobacteriota bacterium]